jgi:hypothetical protein
MEQSKKRILWIDDEIELYIDEQCDEIIKVQQ